MVKIIQSTHNIDTEKYYSKFNLTPCHDNYVVLYNKTPVGILEYYPIINNKLYIKYIEIEEKYRLFGIGKLVIELIKDINKDKYIVGDSSPEAIDFWKNVGAVFDETINEFTTTKFHLI